MPPTLQQLLSADINRYHHDGKSAQCRLHGSHFEEACSNYGTAPRKRGPVANSARHDHRHGGRSGDARRRLATLSPRVGESIGIVTGGGC